jgi:hypothetical protein
VVDHDAGRVQGVVKDVALDDTAAPDPHLGPARTLASENNRGAEHASESGIKWMSGGTKPQCRIVALSLCTTAHPLYTRSTKVIGASIYV